MLDLINPLYAASGFGVGFLAGLTGVGGGSLMTPLLVLLFGVAPATAVGTDLLYAAITKTGGTLVHGARGSVDWRVTARMSAGSVPAAALTLLFLHQFGLSSAGIAHLLSTTLGVALLLTALSLVFRQRILDVATRRFGTVTRERTALLTILCGAVIGVLVSLSSIGAGAVGITVLFLLYPRLPTSTIVGTDIAHAVLLTLVAGIGHWMLGSVDWMLLVSLLAGSLPGIMLGSYSSSRAPDWLLRPALAAVLAVVAGKLLVA